VLDQKSADSHRPKNIKRRENAECTTEIEMPERDAAGLIVFFQKQQSNQETADDEENHHARPGRKKGESKMVQHDDQCTDRP
jgi:hypothetical protein